MIAQLRTAAEVLLSFVAPLQCLICSRRGEHTEGIGAFVCPTCWSNLPVAPPAERLFNELLRHFPDDELALSAVCAAFAFAEHSPEMRLIYGLKYRGLWRVAYLLGQHLGRVVCTELGTSGDALVPVPIHPSRRRERGYNQSEALAKGIAAVTGQPVWSNLLQRRVATPSQTRLSAAQRRSNVAGVFAVRDPERLRGRTVLLVDDVLTTGSTLNSCAEALLNAGACRVLAAVLVRAS
jgi:ComF family protein